MFSLKTHAIISGTIFALLVLPGIGFDVIYDETPTTTGSPTMDTAIKIGVFTLFLALGFSLVPLMIKLWLAGQERIANRILAVVRGRGSTGDNVGVTEKLASANVAFVGVIARHQTRIVLIAWALYALGFAIAIPAMIQDGFFSPQP
ncbi:MAG: hypothetical protein GEU91_07505 [Rhizobiales bacterium]|nr:hypothetical protein [Hyphomicrobiales bacterium]